MSGGTVATAHVSPQGPPRQNEGSMGGAVPNRVLAAEHGSGKMGPGRTRHAFIYLHIYIFEMHTWL